MGKCALVQVSLTTMPLTLHTLHNEVSPLPLVFLWKATATTDIDMLIPLPLTIGVDDAGWQGGSTLNGRKGGPHRMGMD